MSEVPLYQVKKEVMEMNTEDSNAIDDASTKPSPVAFVSTCSWP